ncbi:NIPSNAP family protein [Edaphobacter sp. 12200R-103]|uniref:NIPSNAP family protein n=1 Tax=Edaphobacter sp. 12200R-103 TaxID=2703788 RepID=UPI00138D7CBC|nr:NIPSNAP family protein [Edaphobacter sp. 12200R-103]QHS51834.1 NIPSNAP family containing protein [Edaphobacter sp. 12200R-103]
MQRRSFLKTALASSAAAIAPAAVSAQAPASSGTREYYQLRKYTLRSGPQAKLTDQFFSGALIPALNRLSLSPIGAFKVTFGPQTPTTYLLIPGTNLETVANVDLLLAKDEVFLKAAEPFWSAPAKEPPFERIESTLLKAFEGYPKVTPPTPKNPKRIFQLRTYESPTPADHIRKVEMFHQGEFRIFEKSGCGNVFFSDALVGPNLPKLTYMLTFPDMEALETGWQKFFADPDWKKLTGNPRYNFEPIVSNVDSLILAPAPYSQI